MSLPSDPPSRTSLSAIHFHASEEEDQHSTNQGDLHLPTPTNREQETIRNNEESSISQRKKNNNSSNHNSHSAFNPHSNVGHFGVSSSSPLVSSLSSIPPTTSPESSLADGRGPSIIQTTAAALHASASVSPPTISTLSRRKRRLPQSGLTLCGRRWLLGAEDMCLPACWSAQFDLALVIIAVIAWRYIYTSEYPDTCTKLEKSQIEAYVVMHAVGYAALLALDIGTMMSALYSSMFVRNRTIVLLIYTRLITTILVIIFTLLANIEYFQVLRPSCSPHEDHEGSTTLHHLLTVLFLASLCSFLVFGTYFLCSYGFGPCCGKGTAQSWGKHIRRWLLCYTPTPSSNGRNVLESISWIFTEFFAADRAAHEGEPIHIVPSDILVGFALVEANQVRRAMDGYEFNVAAPLNRWASDAFHPHHLTRGTTEEQTFQKAYGSATVARTLIESNVNVTAGPGVYSTDGPVQQGMPPATASSSSSSAAPLPPTLSTSSSPSPDPLQSAEHGLRDFDRARRLRQQVLDHEKPDQTLMDDIKEGVQPKLDPRDWQKIADAKHFSKYAMGSYGWLLYAFNHMQRFLTCSTCRCCKKHGYDRRNMIGSGVCVGLCGTEGCCHWSIASFLLTTGVQDKDILYAHLSASPIYYLTIDHSQKCLVICCRGTLSVADAVIDLDAQLSPLDNFGYRGGYTHTGILENAIRLRDDLYERGILASFLDHHPSYNLLVVGHSLGAATAALLTLLLRERYDTGPPPVTTASRLTPQTRNRLTCIAYGGPLLVDIGVAHSEFALRCITSIVNHNDIISRLSLATCSLLKDQMISCFAVSSSSKFRILSNSFRKKNYEHSFEPGFDMHEVGSPSSIYSLARASSQSSLSPHASNQSHGGVADEMVIGSIARAMDVLDVLPEEEEHKELNINANIRSSSASSSSPPVPNPLSMGRHGSMDEDHATALLTRADDRNPPLSHNLSPPAAINPQSVHRPSLTTTTGSLPTVPAVVVTGSGRSPNPAAPRNNNTSSSSSTSPHSPSSEFTLHLRKCYLPGRIYHVVPGRRPDGRRCFGLKKARCPSIVYPASQDAFQEIVVNKSMFTDHLPERYQFDRLDIPIEFLEPCDEDRPDEENVLSPSPDP